MLRTIDRYVIREVLPPFFLSLVIFTFLLEIPPIMKELETLVSKGVSWQVAGRMLLTLVPQGLGLTIPMALLTGLLIGLGRLSADREAVALLACGVSPYRLLRPVLALSIVAAAATGYVMLKAIPDANQAFREIAFEVISKRVESDIQPRVFFEDFPGWVLYSRDQTDAGSGWKDVLVANTSRPEATDLFLASRGRLILSREDRRVDLVLTDGTKYSSASPGKTEIYRFDKDLTMGLNPDMVFQRMALPRGITEKTIAELREDAATKLSGGLSPHPEIYNIQQKFSIPAACLVFGVIGLALGLTVSRDGKMGGFVIGLAVIFGYYFVMLLAESQTKGYYRVIEEARGLGSASFLNARLTRWWPNILFGVFGISALIWRARFAERRFPVSLPVGLRRLPVGWTGPSAAGGQEPASARRRVVVVFRFPRLSFPAPGILDRYVSRLYLRMIALSSLGLLGLFYISTFIDVSDKMFKGQASGAMVMELLVQMTPQFVYFVIPIAALLAALATFGLLSRTSELTVMKACGVSLYRTALPIVLLSLLWSAGLFALDQEILARANRRAATLQDQIRGRPARTSNPINRQWMIGRDGSIYHYGFYDPEHRTLTSLSIYRLASNAWRLQDQTFAASASYSGGGWIGRNGWRQDLSTRPPKALQSFAQQPLALEPPDYFETEQADAELMTAAELRRYVNELSASGINVLSQSVELQRKFAFPLVTFVMTLLAIPFGVSAGRRGALYGIGLGIAIALSYWLLSSVFIAIGKAGVLTPLMAAWTPNIIVLACASYLVLTART